jgi:hypothetical protein
MPLILEDNVIKIAIQPVTAELRYPFGIEDRVIAFGVGRVSPGRYRFRKLAAEVYNVRFEARVSL